jgi:hypothetical protein
MRKLDMKRYISLFLALLVPHMAFALGPHEVLVLANKESPDSLHVAQEFMKLRQIPEINLVRLSIPLSGETVPEAISREEFTKLIWEPANRAMHDRRIDDHILAWIYSVDFPTRITVDPWIASISVQGLTFLRNDFPALNVVSNGAYVSPLFSGPSGPGGMPFDSQTFDLFNDWLGDEMPVPSMMLGHTGKRGNNVETIIKCLTTGLDSDGTAPSGKVFFVTSSDVRSKAREWEFAPAKKGLAELGIKAVITGDFPSHEPNVIGIMTGTDSVNPDQKNRYLPGCMAEHLTSAAGMFEDDNQSKLTVWLEAGVTASAGTVVEPFAIWTKFPHAHFFVHYASGCTVIESFYQSIRCPLQILLVGDPLAQPWAPKAKLSVTGLPADTISGKLKLVSQVTSESGGHYSKYVYLIDGKVVGTGREFEFDTGRIEDGPHVMRCVAYRTGLVRCQVFTDSKIVIRNEGKGTAKTDAVKQ